MSRPSQRGPAKPGYLSEDTIAAVASALGGAVAIVRVSGPATRAAIERLTGESELEPRVLVRRMLKDLSGRLLDDAMVVFFEGPRSLTGEDVAEFHLHGSALVASRLLKSLAELGVRQALPGEFSFRAVRNGKTTITQAQA